MDTPHTADSQSSVPPRIERLGVFSRGVARVPRLREFVGAREIVFRPRGDQAKTLSAVAGWGHKPTAAEARRYARVHGVPYLGLEDGFLRSVGLGERTPPLSLIVDDRGIYYDASTPSRLESLLCDASPESPLADPGLQERARSCRARILEAKLSKYNHTPVEPPAALAALRGPLVLVVDQTFGDASVELGSRGAAAFSELYEAALDEHPNATVVIKTHPDVIAGKKRGYLPRAHSHQRALVLADSVNPLTLMERVEHVYTCTSQLGFEALMLGKHVVCFGSPFYAGWGLTEDRVTQDRRGLARTLDELVAAALLLYPRYVHPITGRRCQAEAVIEHLSLQRELFRQNSRRFFCFGFSLWKRPFVRHYLQAPGRKVTFARSPADAEQRGLDPSPTIVVWGVRGLSSVRAWAKAREFPVWQMEDGFLRSVQLGSDLVAPGSLVLDTRGIYYDPSRPSDIEHLLETAEFPRSELERARRLRELIVEAGISKYNPTADRPLETGARPGQRIILVPGQVEDDASVVLGSQTVRNNTELLAAVRQSNPDAYLIYKPHPDVVSGNRRGGSLSEAERLCDQIVATVPISSCLRVVDEVHTMTSLVGFEALLRGKKVVAYGQPFYAGWGLTEDQARHERRSRRRSLDEVVAATLLRYPRYYSLQAQAFCTAEEMVHELKESRAKQASSTPWRTPWVIRKARSLAFILREVVRAP